METTELLEPLSVMPVPLHLTTPELALYLAVMHHGLAASYNGGRPSGKETVLKTAETFQQHLERVSAGTGGESVPECFSGRF